MGKREKPRPVSWNLGRASSALLPPTRPICHNISLFLLQVMGPVRVCEYMVSGECMRRALLYSSHLEASQLRARQKPAKKSPEGREAKRRKKSALALALALAPCGPCPTARRANTRAADAGLSRPLVAARSIYGTPTRGESTLPSPLPPPPLTGILVFALVPAQLRAEHRASELIAVFR